MVDQGVTFGPGRIFTRSARYGKRCGRLYAATEVRAVTLGASAMDDRDHSPPEADLTALLESFPLPIALIGRDGMPHAMSQGFREAYGTAVLGAPELSSVAKDALPHWEAVELSSPDGRKESVHAYAAHFRDEVLILLSDITIADREHEKVDELQRRVHELERRVATDKLTGTWNRGHLERVMAMEMSRSTRYRHPISVVLLDIDHFKRVNDTYGHAKGDLVLRTLVKLVQGRIRPGDMLFRWGGEEFLILLPSTTYQGARVAAEKIRHAVESSDFPGVGSVTISLGVAERSPDETQSSVFERADQALYKAKQSGRNCTVVDPQGASDVWEVSVLRLEWSEKYSSGNALIDSQHRRLFEMANHLMETCLRAPENLEALKDELHQVLSHVQRHFSDEENILEQSRYAGLAQHRRAHAALLKRAGHMSLLADAGMLTFGLLVDFLVHEVVAQHMFTSDREYYPLFRADQPA